MSCEFLIVIEVLLLSLYINLLIDVNVLSLSLTWGKSDSLLV